MTFHIGAPHSHNAGYLVNNQFDKRTKLEADIQSCPHCQKVIRMDEWRKSVTQNFCLKCMKPTCDSSECDLCVPFVKKLEQQMSAQMRFISLLKMAGASAPVTPPSPIYTGST